MLCPSSRGVISFDERIHHILNNKNFLFTFYLYIYILRLEAAQMKFFGHFLGITKLDNEKNQCIREKTGAQNIIEEIK